MDIYDKLGVEKVVNAWGTITRIGGSRMPPEAFAAMTEAGRSYVDMDELHRKAGRYIADLVGVEAAQISSGAAGGMVLAAAACLTGTDREKILALPNTDGWRNEIVVQQSGPGNYVYQGMRHTGAKLVQVGSETALTTADIESGLSENTVAIMIYLGTRPQPSVAEVAPVSRGAGVPLIVDAAAELPPRRNLNQPLADGADLIIFSGGKGICGPQATGLVLGKRELIDACRLNSNPHSSIGRPMKVGKEEIAALIAALEVFVGRDEEAETAEYKRRADYVVAELQGIQGIRAQATMHDPRARPTVPRVYIDLDEGFGLTGREVVEQMRAGDLPIAIGTTSTGASAAVMLLEPWELRAVASKLKGILKSAAGN